MLLIIVLKNNKQFKGEILVKSMSAEDYSELEKYEPVEMPKQIGERLEVIRKYCGQSVLLQTESDSSYNRGRITCREEELEKGLCFLSGIRDGYITDIPFKIVDLSSLLIKT